MRVTRWPDVCSGVVCRDKCDVVLMRQRDVKAPQGKGLVTSTRQNVGATQDELRTGPRPFAIRSDVRINRMGTHRRRGSAEQAEEETANEV